MTAIKTLRKRFNVTQADMAEGMQCTQANISFYEQGQTVPPDKALLLIEYARTLGYTITYDDIYGPLKAVE